MKNKEQWLNSSNPFRAVGIKTVVTTALLTTLCLSPAIADDSEVFFGKVERTKENQPNMVLILDTSWSMTESDPGYEGSRMTRLKKAMTTLLTNSTNVNVALMRTNGYAEGGAVVYPMVGIDDSVCTTGDCGEVHISSKIIDGDDDIEEEDDGDTNLDGEVLNLSGKDPRDNHMIALRFTDLKIPQGATVTSASIGFFSEDDKDSDTVMWIKAEASDNAAPFDSSRGTASSRPGTTAVTWNPDTDPDTAGTQGWQTDFQYSTSDLSSVVQEVVNRPGWCGGHAMSFLIGGNDSGRRDAYAYERSAEKAPVLRISYDSSTISEVETCKEHSLVRRVSAGDDDAEERVGIDTRTWSDDLEMFRDGSATQAIGVRFLDVKLPKNAEILDARIVFEREGSSSGSVNGTIYAQNADNPPKFNGSKGNVTGRPKTPGISWNNIPTNPPDDKWITPNLSDIVERITNRGGWVSGNAMVFILENNGGSGKRAAISYNESPSEAPLLKITFVERGTESIDVEEAIPARDILLATVDDMAPGGNTPIVSTLYEAARYLKGKPVDYGTHRGDDKWAHRVSHPLSYSGGTVERHIWCRDSNLNAWDCRTEKITGNPVYKSPMNSQCQTNHIVLLSDGEANSNPPVEKVRAMTGDEDCTGHDTDDEECGFELASWLSNNDQSSLDGDQFIYTHTIGFNLTSDYLRKIAEEHGGGRYYEAQSASDLVNSFENIFSGVDSIETSFVAPGATVNQFNRLTHRNDIYFALFKPQSRPNWAGNLKKYEIGVNSNGSVIIYDHSSPRKNAINKEEGFFDTESKSDWSTVVDGRDVTLGGAAEQISRNYTADGSGSDRRQMYTYLGSSGSIPTAGLDIRADGDIIHESNTNLTDEHVGLVGGEETVSGVESNRRNLLRWIRGVDVKDEDSDGNSTTDMRAHIGDPMHSRPVIVNYENGIDNDPYTTIYFGTNEGTLHGINNVDGKELFSFMPKSLLENVAGKFKNSGHEPHTYGLDGPITTMISDPNGNVMVDSGESAKLFVGMRRGGSNYYAFDVSNRLNPKLDWVIEGGDGGTPGFENMGQSWSRMVPTKLRYKGVIRDVLIFAGGYDASNDIDYSVGQVPKGEDSSGNMIYIVDAHTGELVYSLGKPGSGATQDDFTAMKYSIPSDVRVLDIDGNGFGDALFVGDLGGQLWRFDFHLYHSAGDGDLVQGGVLASLSGAESDLSQNRRFFYEPDVALVRDNGERFLSIAIGSGWRSHPLNTKVKDRFYVLRSNDVYNMPDGYGKKTDIDTWEPLIESDLTDVTSNVNATINGYGWMLKLERAGEKVLGDAITVNSKVVFSTFLPEAATGDCSPALGGGAVYAMRVSNGSAAADLDDDGDADEEDRSTELNHAGIPPEATALIVESADGKIKPTILVGPEQPLEGKGLFSENLTKRTFWIDAGMKQHGAKGENNDTSEQQGESSSADASGANGG